MKNKKIKETKEKILEVLDGVKEFDVSFGERVYYTKRIKAKSEEKVREMFYDGELEFENKDIIDVDSIDGSLEIDEVED